MQIQDISALKQLPVGITDLVTIFNGNYYYVDKTPFTKSVFKDDIATLITRPRRFGKTLSMETFYNFLRVNPENPSDHGYQDELFKNTKIYDDKFFCQEFMGQWPVILVSFKDVDGRSFNKAVAKLAPSIAETAGLHSYLLKSDKLDDTEKQQFRVLTDPSLLKADPDLDALEFSLKNLSRLLFRYYGKKVIVLVDEYDVPLDKSYIGGYYQDMVDVIQTILSSVLKGNNYLKKAVLTGCLKVSKNSIFTGLNNIKVNSVIDDRGNLASCFGFTKDEVKAMLSYYGLREHESAVKDWYDGYRIDNQEIFCPWDVINFCDQALDYINKGLHVCEPRSYWTATSTNYIIIEFMEYLGREDAAKMQRLLDGEDIDFIVNENLNYYEIGKLHSPDDFWTMLLFTGYLTAVKTVQDERANLICSVRIPNREIRSAFDHCIVDYYRTDPKMQVFSKNIVSAFLKADEGEINFLLEDKLVTFVSSRDFATPSAPENFYQGFLNGMFASQNLQLFTEYRSNEVAGDGFADISFKAKNERTAVVIEIKVTSDKEKLERLAEAALKQINDKNYTEAVSSKSITKILCYGIAFCRKNCFVLCETKNM